MIRTMLYPSTFRNSTWTPNSAHLSQKRAIESTIQTYKGRVTSYLHELIGYYAGNTYCGGTIGHLFFLLSCLIGECRLKAWVNIQFLC
jgi:hypothetical protein